MDDKPTTDREHDQGPERVEKVSQRRQEKLHSMDLDAEIEALVDQALETTRGLAVLAAGSVQGDDHITDFSQDLGVGHGIAVDAALRRRNDENLRQVKYGSKSSDQGIKPDEIPENSNCRATLMQR